MQEKKFQRRIEDFVCEQCGMSVKGTGYTNHCSKCLWSKHVDVNPGDRSALCGGLMEPIGVEGATPEYKILHKCSRCGLTKRNSASSSDSVDALVSLTAKK